MLLERFYDEGLAQASYLVGCTAAGEALVVDPNRDVEQYVRAAWIRGLSVSHVAETHIHADFVSGSRELAERTNALLYLSGEGGDEWEYAFSAGAGTVRLRHGDTLTVGQIRLEVAHTPGHTPEHLCFLVTDTAAASKPMGLFTGDCVFVGDVGRPDLLERAAKITGTMRHSARQLYASLQWFAEQPDYLQVWPGHGAGSACGRSLGAVPQSTVGYERLFNWALQEMSEQQFVDAVLAGQSEPPKYFAHMKRINREGPMMLDGFGRPAQLPTSDLDQLIADGATVVDCRAAGDYALGHVPGTINIPVDRSFATWAGWLVPYTEDFYLIIEEREDVLDRALRELVLIGLDRAGGYFLVDTIDGWTATGRPLEAIPQVTAAHVAASLASGDVSVGDVRGKAEWEAEHLPGVRNIPLGYLEDHIAELQGLPEVVVQCESGARSSVAAGVLRAKGISGVANFVGGLAEWRSLGYPVERETGG